MAHWPFDAKDVAINESFEFLVAWRPGRKDPGVGQLNVAKPVASFLRRAAEDTLNELHRRSPVEYEPSMLLADDEAIVFDDADVIAESPVGKAFLVGVPPLLTAPSLPQRVLTMYAVCAGSGKRRFA